VPLVLTVAGKMDAIAPPSRSKRGAAAAAAAAALTLAACGTPGAAAPATTRAASSTTTSTTTTSLAPGTTSSTTTTSPTTTSTPTSTSTTTTVAAAAGFTYSVGTVTSEDLPYTWRPGCPVGPAQLRMLHLGYVGFDGVDHVGTMVVAASVAPQVIQVFRLLFEARFPIRSMVPEDAFGGHDPASMAADNTSGFNCRDAVAPGPPQWSVHAYGEAVDVDPVENPYLEGGQVQPAAGAAYLDRRDVRAGMAVWGGTLVDAFASVGWLWGGRWTDSPDYQHFSATGG
jgi:hypothetical protein